MEGKKRGQPKKSPTKIINFRVLESDKILAQITHGDELNTMFQTWFQSILPKK